MCGRYTLATPVAELSRIFGFPELPNLSPRYNIAPTQDIAAVRLLPEEERRELVLMRWGLVPYWADDPSIGSRMINARSESVAEKPAFRSAFARRRCLVLVDGFYEWQQHGVPKGGKKQPFRIRRRDGQPFAFAGLWESWKGPKGGPALEHPLETATIVTTDANRVLKPLHDRMPVILAPEDYDAWLDSGNAEGGCRSAAAALPGGLAGSLPGQHPRQQRAERGRVAGRAGWRRNRRRWRRNPGSPGCCRDGMGEGMFTSPLQAANVIIWTLRSAWCSFLGLSKK